LTAATKAIATERDALAAKARALAQATPVQPLALLHAIGETLPKDAVVIEEALSSAPGIRQLIRSDDPQSYFGLRGGGIGWGLRAARRDRREARLARSAGGRPHWRRQRDVYLPGPVDRRALSHRRGLRHSQQQLLPYSQAAPACHARARRAGRHLCRHGTHRPQDRLRVACALAWRCGGA